MRVLITGIGGPTPRSFVHAARLDPSLAHLEWYGTDIQPHAIGLYQRALFKKTHLLPPASRRDAYWSALESLVKKEGIQYAVILPEAEVLAWSERYFQTGMLPCQALLPHYPLANILVDKAKMTSLLEPHGLVPPSFTFTRTEDATDAMVEKTGLPFWVRSTTGTSGLGSLKVNNLRELKQWIHINPTVETFIASRYLPGRNLACKMLYYRGKLLRSACAERVQYIMAKVAPSGITGNTSFGRLLNLPHVEALAEKALSVLFKETESEAHGFFTVDFKEDLDGIPFITEINVRHVAFTQCFAMAGANFAADTLRLMMYPHTVEQTYKPYRFEEGLIFLRDVDERPLLMKESELLS